MEDKKIEVGDIVAPNCPEGVLACGSGLYDYAIVVSVDPFVLVSKDTDMVWSSTVVKEQYKVIGYADEKTFQRCLDHWTTSKIRQIQYANMLHMKEFYRKVSERVGRMGLDGFERATKILKERDKKNG